MIGVTEILLLAAVAAGVGCCCLGYLCYRRWNEPGSTAFGVFLGLWGAVPIAGVLGGSVNETISAVVQIVIWCLATVCWFLFALQYTGTSTRIRAKVVGALAVPSLVVVPWLWGPLSDGRSALLEAFGTLVLTSYSGLVIIGAVLLFRVTRSYGHLSVRHGALLVVTGAVPCVTNIAFGIVVSDTGLTPLSAGLFLAGFLGVLVAAAATVFRFGTFETTLAAGTIGERAIARESDDLIVIADDDERVLKLNDAAVRTLGVRRTDALGDTLQRITTHGIEQLEREDTVELHTPRGTRTVDAQVTELTDQHACRLGWMVTLRDVTDREIQRQRLEVLNRIIRHNLRNQVGVIKAHSEAVADAVEEDEIQDHLDTMADSADSLATLGRKTKTVEELLGTGRSASEICLRDVAESVVTDCERRWPTAAITLAGSDDVPVDGDRAAVEFIVENLVETVLENTDAEQATVELALTFDDGAQYPARIEVISDDASLSERDIEVIEAGTETPLKHGSGVRLWVTNWTVTDIGGELAFRDDGSLIQVHLPAQPGTEETGDSDSALTASEA